MTRTTSSYLGPEPAPAPVRPTTTERLRRSLRQLPIYLIAAVLSAVVLIPLVYVVLGGFRTTGQVAADPVALPNPWRTENYKEVLGTSSPFWRQAWNSLLIATLTTAGVTTLGAHVAFALSRIQFRGREALYAFFTVGLLFPIAVAVLPLFIQLRRWDLLDNPLGIVLPQIAFELPITIVILRPFMRAVPAELEDAAAIDGCSRFGFFWRILIPNSWPALVTVSVITFVTSWNAYLLPKLVLNDPDTWTLPQGVFNYSTQYTADTARVLAFTALSMVPALCFFVVAERKIVAGLTGAVKG